MKSLNGDNGKGQVHVKVCKVVALPTRLAAFWVRSEASSWGLRDGQSGTGTRCSLSTFGFSVAVAFHQCPERISFVYHIRSVYSIMLVRDIINYKTLLSRPLRMPWLRLLLSSLSLKRPGFNVSDLWRTKWHWNRIFSKIFHFPMSESFHPCCVTLVHWLLNCKPPEH